MQIVYQIEAKAFATQPIYKKKKKIAIELFRLSCCKMSTQTI